MQYNKSDEGTIPAGVCSQTIQFKFYPAIEYGTNLSTQKSFIKDAGAYALTIDPQSLSDDADDTEWKAKAITQIKIILPDNVYIKYIQYVPQQDFTAMDLFSTTANQPSDGFKTMTYSLSGERMRFAAKSTYVIRLNDICTSAV